MRDDYDSGRGGWGGAVISHTLDYTGNHNAPNDDDESQHPNKRGATRVLIIATVYLIFNFIICIGITKIKRISRRICRGINSL